MLRRFDSGVSKKETSSWDQIEAFAEVEIQSGTMTFQSRIGLLGDQHKTNYLTVILWKQLKDELGLGFPFQVGTIGH